MSLFKTVNPTTNQTLDEYELISEAELAAAVHKANSSFSSWSQRPVTERAKFLWKIAELYENNAEDLARDVALEMGKPLTQARAEIGVTASIYQYYARDAEALLTPSPLDVEGTGTAVLRKDPIGVLLAIMPWNFPHYQVARIVAPNLALGNTVLLKHATLCGKTAMNILNLMQNAGIPEGVYTNLFASHEQLEELIGDYRVRGVSLTGSDRAGERIGSLAGHHLKPAVLELGGSDAFIVLEDADIERAARDAVVARCNNAGQQCTAGKRFIIQDTVYEHFMSLFIQGMKSVIVGDPLDVGTEMGPLSSKAALEQLKKQVADAIEDGAEVLTGGHEIESTGNFFAPTILGNVDGNNRAYYQEFFGPVAMVFQFSSISEAITLANDSPFGLSAAVYTEDSELVDSFSKLLDTGMVYINTPSKSAAELPFGGVKRSGIGRELGPLGITEFANLKLVRQI